MGRVLAGLLVIDAVVIAIFGFVDRKPAPVAPPAGSPQAQPPSHRRGEADAAPRTGPATTAAAGPQWNGVDAAALGRRVGSLYLATRRQIGRNKRVVLLPPRRAGDDVEVRVALATGVGYPASLYCFHCETQRCLFSDASLAGFGALATALPLEDVRDLARMAGPGKDRVQVRYLGSASGGSVVTRSEVQTCEDGKPTTLLRFPMDYDVYDEEECGAHECEIAGSGGKLRLDSGRIDDNKKLACLRAMCLKQADLGDVPVKYVGELAFEQGTASRGAEVALVVRGIGGDGPAYAAFWDALSATLGAEPR